MQHELTIKRPGSLNSVALRESITPEQTEVIRALLALLKTGDHYAEVIEAHHFAYLYEDKDNKGPKGGKQYVYVCSCGDGYTDRKNLAQHQIDELKR